MLKLLIVDDERLDREGLKEQIDWGKFGISEVETAKNGFEAINIMNTFKPDILITDIKMPGMSGLELAEKAVIIMPRIKIVFVSGYDDFEYVRNALKIRAYEYILKPVDSEELINVLKQIISEILEERRVEQEKTILLNNIKESEVILKKNLLLDLVNGSLKLENIWDEIEKLNIKINKGYYYVVILEIDDYKYILQMKGIQKINEIHENIIEILKGIIRTDCLIEYIQIQPWRYILVFSMNARANEEIDNNDCVAISEEIIAKMKTKYDTSLTIAIGNSVNKIEDINISYSNSCQAIVPKLYKGKGKVLLFQPKVKDKSENIDFQNICNELMQAIKSFDINRANYFINYLFESFSKCNILNEKYIINCSINILSRIEIILLDMNEQKEDIFGENVILWSNIIEYDALPDVMGIMKDIFQKIISYLENKNSNKKRKLVKLVIKYIDDNYSKDLTLKDIANHFYYSPNYLGALFKEEIGKGFADYLTEVRMKKAAELLKQTQLKAYEVAGMIGYKNLSAFINQFKINFEVTPKEYRERF